MDQTKAANWESAFSEWSERQIYDRLRALEIDSWLREVSIDEWATHPRAMEYRALMKVWWQRDAKVTSEIIYSAEPEEGSLSLLTAKGQPRYGFNFSPKDRAVAKMTRRLLGDSQQ